VPQTHCKCLSKWAKRYLGETTATFRLTIDVRRDFGRCGRPTRSGGPQVDCPGCEVGGAFAYALSSAAHSLADADAHGGKCEPCASLAEFQRRGAGDAGAAYAERMAKRDGTAMGFTCAASSAIPSCLSTAMPGEAKASLSSATSKSVGQAEPGARVVSRHQPGCNWFD
jgi:hypothetical protein